MSNTNQFSEEQLCALAARFRAQLLTQDRAATESEWDKMSPKVIDKMMGYVFKTYDTFLQTNAPTAWMLQADAMIGVSK